MLLRLWYWDSGTVQAPVAPSQPPIFGGVPVLAPVEAPGIVRVVGEALVLRDAPITARALDPITIPGIAYGVGQRLVLLDPIMGWAIGVSVPAGDPAFKPALKPAQRPQEAPPLAAPPSALPVAYPGGAQGLGEALVLRSGAGWIAHGGIGALAHGNGEAIAIREARALARTIASRIQEITGTAIGTREAMQLLDAAGFARGGRMLPGVIVALASVIEGDAIIRLAPKSSIPDIVKILAALDAYDRH